MSRFLRAALAYARAGIPVLPLLPDTKEPAYKLVPNAAKNASSDLEKVREWWGSDDYNIGLAGSGSTVFIDVDRKSGQDGLASLKKICNGNSLPRTRSVTTPNNGYHFWFRITERNGLKGWDHKGVEFRVGNRYVVAPPSIVEGRPYTFRSNDPIAALPPWWYELKFSMEQSDVELKDQFRVSKEVLERLLKVQAFKRIWKDEDDFGGDTSRRDFALVSQALRQGATKEQAGGLLYVKRGKLENDPKGRRKDYVEHTLSKASAAVQAVTGARKRSREGSLTVGLDEIESRPAEWAWENWLPLGGLTVQTGVEGLGKSLFSSWYIERLTTGTLRGDLQGTPVNVLIIAGEDSLQTTWKPRLSVAEADPSHVEFLKFEELGIDWNIQDGAEELFGAVTDMECQFLYVDSVMDLMPPAKSGESVNSPVFVRRALEPLSRLVQKLDIACLFTLHPPKGVQSSSDFRNLVQASHAFTAKSRVGWQFAWHPDDMKLLDSDPSKRRVLMKRKDNLGAPTRTLEFSVKTVEYNFDKPGRFNHRGKKRVAVACDVRECDISIIDIRRAEKGQSTKAEEESKLEKAMTYIQRKMIENGTDYVDALQAEKDLDEQEIHIRTGRRAAREMGLKSIKSKEGWRWVPDE